MNNITTVNGHVLLPHQADWSTLPQPRRQWRGTVAAALNGDEDRAIVRDTAWINFRYEILPFNQVERNRVEQRIMAGLKCGKMAVPYFGRGVPIESDLAAGATSIETLSGWGNADVHRITVGQYILVQSQIASEFDRWDLSLVTVVVGRSLTIANALGNAYLQNATRLWPLLFGRPVQGSFRPVNANRARYPVELQNDARRDGQFYTASEDWSDYAEGAVTGELNGGSGWSGGWEMYP